MAATIEMGIQPDDRSTNVARYLRIRGRGMPDGTAVLAPRGNEPDGTIRYERLSFAQLDGESDALAHGLRASGVNAGTRVLLMVRPGSDLIRCCFALFKAGAVPVVIDPGMGMRSFLRCVERSQPEVLLGLPWVLWLSRAFRKAFASVRVRIPVGGKFRDWFGAFEDGEFPIHAAAADELAAVLFTSGSTGSPKGVRYGHGQFDGQVRLIRDSFGISEGEVDLPMLPIFALFNPALGMTTVVPQMNPGKPAMVNPARIIRAIEQCGVTNSFGSPVLWKKIAAHAESTGWKYANMRRILMAGAPVPPALLRRLQPVLPGARLISPYGATECLPVTAIEATTVLNETATGSESGAGTCVGLPVAGVTVRIIAITEEPISDLADARLLPEGEIGEILVTGPTVTDSYDGLPEATARAKIRDGDRCWHRMGDAGYLDAEGRLWFCGRLVERVQTASGTLYTDRVEGIMNTLPGVARSALIGIGQPPDQLPAMVIEPEPGARITEAQVRQHAAQFPQLPALAKICFCRSFPVDVRHNAKIHRLELAKRYA